MSRAIGFYLDDTLCEKHSQAVMPTPACIACEAERLSERIRMLLFLGGSDSELIDAFLAVSNKYLK